MATRIIHVSEEEDRKLWELIIKNKWKGTCLDRFTYAFTPRQLQLIRKAGIAFNEASEHQSFAERERMVSAG